MRIKKKAFYIGRKLYVAKQNDIEYKPYVISSIDEKLFTIKEVTEGYSVKIKGLKLGQKRWFVQSGRWNYEELIFLYEAEAMRYVKAQLMKALKQREDNAKEAIQKLKNFREKYWEELNFKYLDSNIQQIENSIQL